LIRGDGSRDNTFNIGAGFMSTAQTIIQQNDGNFVIGSYFDTYQGVAAYIARLNTDGSRAQ
jgi:hypothetical protein